jgi:hypothetical protein
MEDIKRMVVPVSLSDVGYPILSELSRELVSMMRENDAPNFIGLQLDDEQGTPWMLTIQRVEGETPEMQCGRLRAQLAESERRRVELVEAVRPVVKWWEGRSARYGNGEAIAIMDTVEGNHVTAAQISALAALAGEGK